MAVWKDKDKDEEEEEDKDEDERGGGKPSWRPGLASVAYYYPS